MLLTEKGADANRSEATILKIRKNLAKSEKARTRRGLLPTEAHPGVPDMSETAFGIRTLSPRNEVQAFALCLDKTFSVPATPAEQESDFFAP